MVVAEAPKRVERLGETFRLPVEVVRFGWRDTRRRLAPLLPDARAAAARRRRGVPDRRRPLHPRLRASRPDADIDALDAAIKQVPGVMEHGLFIGMAERALLGREDGSVVLERPLRCPPSGR